MLSFVSEAAGLAGPLRMGDSQSDSARSASDPVAASVTHVAMIQAVIDDLYDWGDELLVGRPVSPDHVLPQTITPPRRGAVFATGRRIGGGGSLVNESSYDGIAARARGRVEHDRVSVVRIVSPWLRTARLVIRISEYG